MKMTTPIVAAMVFGASMALTATFSGPAQAGEPVELAAMTEMAKPLTDQAGDPATGKKVFSNRKLGNCLACHSLQAMKEQPFHGEVAPPLDGVASRYSIAELRLRVANPKAINPETQMPAYFRKDGLHRVMDKFKDKTILTAQQVEDLVAYLGTLKEE
ncbi:MAG: sulfur oxidation c-type cytochrome SoxX [Rhodospirillaceae bacterium]|nr:sulfur oxidation c-type cytochrome SoxX [Rhodospirillaceae bacterium]